MKENACYIQGSRLMKELNDKGKQVHKLLKGMGRALICIGSSEEGRNIKNKSKWPR